MGQPNLDIRVPLMFLQCSLPGISDPSKNSPLCVLFFLEILHIQSAPADEMMFSRNSMVGRRSRSTRRSSSLDVSNLNHAQHHARAFTHTVFLYVIKQRILSAEIEKTMQILSIPQSSFFKTRFASSLKDRHRRFLYTKDNSEHGDLG